MRRLRSIISIGLALLVIFASSSFSVGLHICGGEVRNIALFGKADGCEKEKQLPRCYRHEVSSTCCQDKTLIHDSDNFRADAVQVDGSPSAIEYFIPGHVILDEIVSSISITSPHYYDYDPPLRSCDLTVEHQVFLI